MNWARVCTLWMRGRGYRLALHRLRDRVWEKPEEGRCVALQQLWATLINVAFLIFYPRQVMAAAAYPSGTSPFFPWAPRKERQS